MTNSLSLPVNTTPKITSVINGLNDTDFTNSYLSNFFPDSECLKTNHWDLSNNSFFNSNNLEKDIIKLLKPLNCINESDLNSVLIYSIFNHYIDGFKYFKNFIRSILNNDFKIAAHLLYYAEFRWLSCLLGTQGIFGVGKKTYLYSTTNGLKNFGLTGAGSHEALWLIFTHWCETNEAEALFKRSFEVQGHSVSEWIREANLMTSSGSKVLSDLIFNLTNTGNMNYLNDRNFRNLASYDGLNKPTAFNELNLRFSFDFLTNHYNGLLSLDSDNNFFEILDLEILKVLITRKTYQQGSKNIKKARHKHINKIYKSISLACNRLNKGRMFGNKLTESIVKENIFESLLLSAPEQTDKDALLKIFYRTLLLMKLAASSIKFMLHDAGLNPDYLKPWLLKKVSHSFWMKELDIENEFDLSEISYNSRLDYFSCFSDLEPDFIEMAKNNSIEDLWDIDISKNIDILKLSDIDIASIWSLA